MINFLVQSPLFLLASLFFFILPGNLIWQQSKLRGSFWEKFIFSLSIGFVSFTLLSYVLLYFKIDYLILLISILVNLIWVTNNYSSLKKIELSRTRLLNKKNLLVLLVFVLGILGQLAVISPSGVYLDKDLVFWSSHGHDASWHIALIEELKKGAPWQNPVYAGEKLTNYHFFSDLNLVIFNKYFGLNSVDLYFRLYPLLYSILLGGTVFYLTKILTNSFPASLWAVFFTYFAGSFGYIVTFLQSRTLSGETIFGSSQVQSTIGNPPQITASINLIAFLYFFTLFLKERNKYLFFISTLFASTLIVFKVYAGVVLLGSLFLIGFWQFFKEQRLSILIMSVVSTFVSLLLYLPNTTNSASFLIWEPWWHIRTLIVYPNKLNWLDLELRRQTYLAEGNLKRVISIELMSFFIFFFGNLGMRFIGLWSFIKLDLSSSKNYLNQLIMLIIIISFSMPMFFLQKGVASNTIQFLHYFLLLFGILAGISTTCLLNRIKIPILKYIIILLVISLSIPTQIGLLVNFYSRPPIAKIEKQEFEALNFLKNNSDENSVILTAPFNKYLDLKTSTPPIWAWSDSAYVSAFSARRVYLEDSEQVDIMGYNLKKRSDIQSNIFENINEPNIMLNSLKQSNISYLYFPKISRPKTDLNKTSLIKIFDNGKYEIWKVNY